MSLFRLITSSILLTVPLFAQESGNSTFHTTTTTVLVPFNVQRGKYFAADLQASDFILLEDGHPRQFTLFEGPNTPHPLPLELILVFDISRIPSNSSRGIVTPVWDPKADYEFLNDWDEGTTRTVLHKNGMDVRLSVYHFDNGHFERLCRASRDPEEIGEAFRKLLSPIPAVNQLTLLPGNRVFEGRILSSPGWWMEATVAALRDVAVSPVAARRMMFLLSDLWGGTVPASGAGGRSVQAIGNEALSLGIPIDPVIMDYYKMAASLHMTGDNPNMGLRGSSIPVRMPNGSTRYVAASLNAKLGEMTGGEVLIPEHLTRDALANILQLVRDAMLSKYLVGFVPDASTKPVKHNLQVELKSKTAAKMVGGEREGVVY